MRRYEGGKRTEEEGGRRETLVVRDCLLKTSNKAFFIFFEISIIYRKSKPDFNVFWLRICLYLNIFDIGKRLVAYKCFFERIERVRNDNIRKVR